MNNRRYRKRKPVKRRKKKGKGGTGRKKTFITKKPRSSLNLFQRKTTNRRQPHLQLSPGKLLLGDLMYVLRAPVKSIMRKDVVENSSSFVLPNEILFEILTFMDFKSVVRFRNVCRRHYQLIGSPQVKKMMKGRRTSVKLKKRIHNPFPDQVNWLEVSDPEDRKQLKKLRYFILGGGLCFLVEKKPLIKSIIFNHVTVKKTTIKYRTDFYGYNLFEVPEKPLRTKAKKIGRKSRKALYRILVADDDFTFFRDNEDKIEFNLKERIVEKRKFVKKITIENVAGRIRMYKVGYSQLYNSNLINRYLGCHSSGELFFDVKRHRLEVHQNTNIFE